MTQHSITHRPRIHRFGDVIRQFIALTLVVALAPVAPLFAQAAAVSQAMASTPMSLHITILEGEDSLNDIRERTAREPIVEVEDENHKPVAGALVLFSIQNGSSGAGGTFADGLQTLRVTTDVNGRAVAHGIQLNKVEGQFAIGVTATLGTLVVVSQIRQGNVSGGGSGSGEGGPNAANQSIGQKVGRFSRIPKKVYITGGAVVTVGVVVGVVVATRGNNPTTITPGTGTVTGP